MSPRNEAGSALVIALVFLSVFAVWISTTLSAAGGGLRVTESLRTQRPELYAVDGAVEQAIQAVRSDSSMGRDDTTSCDATATLNGQQVHVRCTPQAGSGLPGIGGSSPTLGILTLATGNELGYQQSSNSTVRINGGLYSNSKMTPWPGGSKSQLNACPPSFPATQGQCSPQNASGTVTVVGACDASNIVAEVLYCNAAPSPAGSDPNYPPDQTAFTSVDVRTVPSTAAVCPGGYALVLFSPGWYTGTSTLNALNALTAGGGCDHSLLWFRPGTYYFDFPGVWTVDDETVTVVGGQKTWPGRSVSDAGIVSGSTALTSAAAAFTAADVGRRLWGPAGVPADTKIASVTNATTVQMSRAAVATASAQTLSIEDLGPDPSTAPFGTLCNGDILNDHPGVEFIFGGTARMAILKGKLELCAPVALLRQQIAVYGVKTGIGTLVQQSGCITYTGTPFVQDADASHCALITTGGNKSWFMVKGTIYVPAAVLQLKMNNVGYQVVTRGVISRVLSMHVTPSSDFSGALISSPGLGSATASDREVFFTACTVAPCGEPGAVTKLRARAKFHDTPYPGSSVTVESWTVVR